MSRPSVIIASQKPIARVEKQPKIGFVSLGCPKALVDSEHILTRLRSENYTIVPDYASAHLVVVNTCGFIDSAVEESLDSIGEALAENGSVIVMGCLGERAELVRERYPKVLEVLGARSYEAVMQAIHAHLAPPVSAFDSLIPPQGIKLTPRHYAYLKVAEGCNHSCTFCIIPSLRGELISRPVASVLNEAESLVNAGVQELLVIAQDTSAYGLDLGYAPSVWQGREIRSDLFHLAEALGDLGVWVRLHYVYPYPQVDQTIALMVEKKLLPYLDVPLQHASERILRAMGRPANSDNSLARIKKWREMCPDLTLRSTFIVGFPGETEADFQQLLDFLTEAQIDRVGAFTYSAVEGAAANTLPDPVPEEVKQERYDRLMRHQISISRQRLQRKVGKTLEVLIDSKDEKQIIARTQGDAPEIDGVVFIPHTKKTAAVRVGERIQVKITAVSGDYDLIGSAY